MLNRREYLEKRIPDVDTIAAARWFREVVEPCQYLALEAAKFLRNILGEEVRSTTYLADETYLESFAEQVSLLIPALDAPNPNNVSMKAFFSSSDSSITAQEVVNDLFGIANGDEPLTFGIAIRKQGQPRRPYRISLLRCRALYWDAFLKQIGHLSVDRHRLISDAFRTDFDTIRKWKKSALKVLGKERLDRELRVGTLMDYEKDQPLNDFAFRIGEDGDRYWKEKLDLETTDFYR